MNRKRPLVWVFIIAWMIGSTVPSYGLCTCVHVTEETSACCSVESAPQAVSGCCAAEEAEAASHPCEMSAAPVAETAPAVPSLVHSGCSSSIRLLTPNFGFTQDGFAKFTLSEIAIPGVALEPGICPVTETCPPSPACPTLLATNVFRL